MKTHSEFDYDLWTTEENGVVKNWSRVKSTGEVSEITDEVMRFLNAEDKRLRRQLSQAVDADITVLSLDMPLENGFSLMDTITDSLDMEYFTTTHLAIEEIKQQLSPGQLDYYVNVVENGQTLTEYAKKRGIAIPTAYNIGVKIGKKMKKVL